MQRIHRHYERVLREISVEDNEAPLMPSRNTAIVLVGAVTLPVLRALAYARSTRPSSLEAVSVAVTPEDAAQLRDAWQRHGIDVPLRILDSPYREITRPSSTTSRASGGRARVTSSRCSSRSTSWVTGGSTCCTTRVRCG